MCYRTKTYGETNFWNFFWFVASQAKFILKLAELILMYTCMFCKYSLRKHRDIKSIFYKYVSVDDDKLKPTHTCDWWFGETDTVDLFILLDVL